jgi:bifunctional non-homologous end joining protein LigD
MSERSDQLSLDLDAERPGLPADLRPMLPRTAVEPFDDSDHLFEPWWGGERAFAIVELDESTGAGTVRIPIRRGEDVSAVVPELAGSGGLIGRLGGRSGVMDGCLVAVDSAGRPDPLTLAERLAGRPGGPVVYLAFDLVALDGRPLIGEPLERRRELLRRIVEPGGPLLVVPAIPGEGRALHAAAGAQGIPATIARHRRSPYLPGVRSRLWQLVPTGVETAAADGRDRPVVGSAGLAVVGEPATATAPILALIQRLPLDPE